jgi:hypothetical protein
MGENLASILIETTKRYYGILRGGGIVVPMNVLPKGREVGFYVADPA